MLYVAMQTHSEEVRRLCNYSSLHLPMLLRNMSVLNTSRQPELTGLWLISWSTCTNAAQRMSALRAAPLATMPRTSTYVRQLLDFILQRLREVMGFPQRRVGLHHYIEFHHIILDRHTVIQQRYKGESKQGYVRGQRGRRCTSRSV